MARRFEDLIVWQKARELTRSVYELTKRDAFSKDFGLRNQIRSAAVSVVSNIAEGYERDRDTEFAQFLTIAKGSCAQLYVALDQGYIDSATFAEASERAAEVSRILKGLTKSVREG